ncbi:MAG: hypothetical protein HQK59_08560 [Deltaproteobacteria bacterium]|nr:hypothetical protein [Deltaproteobacteria bacterium]
MMTNIAREKTAALDAEKYGFNLKSQDIIYDGCLAAGGRLIGFAGLPSSTL